MVSAGESLLVRGSGSGAGDADGSVRASTDGSSRAGGGVPLRSAMKGGGGNKRPVQKTALQLSAGVRIQEPERTR